MTRRSGSSEVAVLKDFRFQPSRPLKHVNVRPCSKLKMKPTAGCGFASYLGFFDELLASSPWVDAAEECGILIMTVLPLLVALNPPKSCANLEVQ